VALSDLSLHLYVLLAGLAGRVTNRVTHRAVTDQRGQASAEYALVLLGAAAVALLVVAWATKTDLIEKLLEKVMKAITGKVS
jgi:Flp pilus assembly pilin Flp